MKKVFLLLLPTLIVFFASTALGQNSEIVEVSLDEVSQLALNNSLDVQLAKYETFISNLSLDKTESIFDTFLTANSGINRNKADSLILPPKSKSETNLYSLGLNKKTKSGTVLSANLEDTRTSSSTYAVNPAHQAKAQVSLTQSLGRNFLGIADRNNIKINKIDIENSRWVQLSLIEQTLAQAQSAYWNLAYFYEEINIRGRVLVQAQRLYDIHQDKYKDGLVEKGDLYATKANLETRKNDLEITKLKLKTVQNELLFLLNKGSFNLELIPSDSLEITPQLINLTQSLRQAINNRRDYKQAKNQVKAMGLVIETQKNAKWPKIDLTLSYSLNGIHSSYTEATDELYDENQSELYAGLAVELPLENKLARAVSKESDLKKKQVLLTIKKIESLILRELNDKVNNANSLMKRLELYTAIKSLQRKKLQHEHLKLHQGRSSADFIIRYENELLEAELAYLYTLLQYRLSLASLDLAKNTLLDKYWEGKL